MKEISLFLAGLCAGVVFLGDPYWYVGVLIPVFLGVWSLNRSQRIIESAPTQVIQQVVKEQEYEMGSPFEKNVQKASEKGMEYKFKKKFLHEMEGELDTHLFEALRVLRRQIPTAHTVSLFFPGRRPGTLVLRVYDSECELVLPQAEISEGQGFIGRLMKPDVNRVYEVDIENSRALFYYKELVEVHAVMAIPIFVEGVFNGALVVDSLEQGAFGPDQLEDIRNWGQTLGLLAYKYYLGFEHLYQKEQFSALLEYQKRFLKDSEISSVYQHLVDFIESNLHFERLMILERVKGSPDLAKVVVAKGVNADAFLDKEMEIVGKAYLSLIFLNNAPLNRIFKSSEYIYRVASDEYRTEGLKSITAIPVCTNSHQVDLVLSIESASKTEYSKHHIDLLMSVGSMAGFALSRARAFEEREQAAVRDGLTGLYNHRAFQEKLKNESLRARRSGSSLGLIMLDIDHFKSVNDRFGHPSGDAVLKHIAKFLNQQVREGIDSVCRYGGEEFILLIPDCNAKIVADLAERIRSITEQTTIAIPDGETLNVTISLGYAIFPEHAIESKKLVELADKAMYQSKQSGRNQVTGYK